MPEQPSAGLDDVPTVEEAAQLVLDLLLTRYPALVAVEELMQDLADPHVARPVPRVFVEDGIDQLLRAGLVHKLDRFLFATHTAVRGGELRR